MAKDYSLWLPIDELSRRVSSFAFVRLYNQTQIDGRSPIWCRDTVQARKDPSANGQALRLQVLHQVRHNQCSAWMVKEVHLAEAEPADGNLLHLAGPFRR
jgi:hypothetical protein